MSPGCRDYKLALLLYGLPGL